MKRTERILLIGLGGVGHMVAHRLSRDGHSLTVIERDPARIAASEGDIDARFLVGDVLDFSVWREAECHGVDTLIAVTDDDAANILAVRIAERHGIRQKIARIRNIAVWEPGAPLSAKDLHIDLVIRPEELAAREVARLLNLQGSSVAVDIGDGHHQVLTLLVDRSSPLNNQVVRELSQVYKGFDFQIVCVARDIETILPGGDFRILEGDHVYIMASAADVPHLLRQAGVTQTGKHHVLIVGGGLIGARVAELLQDEMPVRLLERDEHRAEELSFRLENTACMHGDGSRMETLMQAGLGRVDTFVAATGDNETNILTCLLARHARQASQAVSTIALVKREEYTVLASAIGTDVAVNKKTLAANLILRHIRRGHVLSVAHLHGCDAEVVEVVADPGSPITKKPLRTFPDLRDHVRIGCVLQDGDWTLAGGDTRIAAGQRAVCVCHALDLPRVQNLFLAP